MRGGIVAIPLTAGQQRAFPLGGFFRYLAYWNIVLIIWRMAK